MRNGDTAPQAVHTFLGREWAAFDALPKPIRLALVEANYEYSAEQVLDGYRYHLENWSRNPVKDILSDIMRNDIETKRVEDAKKATGEWSRRNVVPT